MAAHRARASRSLIGLLFHSKSYLRLRSQGHALSRWHSLMVSLQLLHPQVAHTHISLHVMLGELIVFNDRSRLICLIYLLLIHWLVLHLAGRCSVCIDDCYIIDGHGRLGCYSTSLAHSACVPSQFLAWRGQPEALQNVQRNLERVQIRLKELLSDLDALLFDLLYVFEHAEGHLPLNFFSDSGIQSRIKSNYRGIIYQGILDNRFYAKCADAVPRNVDSLDVLVIAESLLQTRCELVPKLIPAED